MFTEKMKTGGLNEKPDIYGTEGAGEQEEIERLCNISKTQENSHLHIIYKS